MVKAINLALGNRDSMMTELQENIGAVIWKEDETSAEGINAKLEELQKELLRLANSKKDYNNVADEIDRLRELKQKALTESAEREGLKKRIVEMREFRRIFVYDKNIIRLPRQYTGNSLKSLDLSGKRKVRSSVLDQV